MGWKSEAVVANEVIIEGPNDGLFVYNGTPALGNLIASIVQAAGTDPYGNAFLEQITSYHEISPTSLTAIQMSASSDLRFYTATSAAGPWTNTTTIGENAWISTHAVIKIVPGSQVLINVSGLGAVTSALLEVQGNAVLEAGKAAGVTGSPALVVGAPAAAGDAIVHIADDPSNPRSGSANMLQIEDHSAAPIFAVGAAGGAKVFGDKMGSWNGIGSMAAQFVPWYGMQTGGSSGPTIYGGSGAPLPALITGGLTTYSQTAHVGDYYFRTDTPAVANQRLYVCTVAGNPGTWVGIL